MTTEPDDFVRLLGDLQAHAPASARDARIRSRCHAAIAAPHAPPDARRTSLTRVVDIALAIAVSLYGGAAVVEAIRIGWRPPS